MNELVKSNIQNCSTSVSSKQKKKNIFLHESVPFTAQHVVLIAFMFLALVCSLFICNLYTERAWKTSHIIRERLWLDWICIFACRLRIHLLNCNCLVSLEGMQGFQDTVLGPVGGPVGNLSTSGVGAEGQTVLWGHLKWFQMTSVHWVSSLLSVQELCI